MAASRNRQRTADFSDLPEGFDPTLAFDLDGFEEDDAVRAEAERKPIPVKIGGKWIAFPQTADWPYDATDALDAGDMMDALSVIFDPEEDGISEEESADRKDTLKILDGLYKKKNATISALFEHISEKSGVSPGESNRSERRSRSSRRR